MLQLEVRETPSRGMVFGSPLLALSLTVLMGIALFLIVGKDPLQGLLVFFYEPLKNSYALTELTIKASPLILIGLGLAISYRANVWNIGAEGQYILGAIFAAGVSLMADEHTGRWILLVIVFSAILGGMVWAAITALLRDRFNANEILVSLMLVYIAQMLLSYLVYGPWKDPEGFNFPKTKTFEAVTQLPRLIEGFRMNISVVIVVFTVIAAYLFIFRSFAGYQLQVTGLAPRAAQYAGFSSRKMLWIALMVSGGLAGLAGGLEIAGPLNQLTPHVPAGYGFAAIIVAFIGRLHPIGVVLAGILISMFYIGGELAQSRLGMPRALTGVFQGLMLFNLLACDTLIHYRIKRVKESKKPTNSLKETRVQA